MEEATAYTPADEGLHSLSNGLRAYLDHLVFCLHENGSCEHTESGHSYCGCDQCEIREIMTYIFSRPLPSNNQASWSCPTCFVSLVGAPDWVTETRAAHSCLTP